MMKARTPNRFALTVIAAALLAACGGSQAPLSTESAAHVTTATQSLGVTRQARESGLLYVSFGLGGVNIYDYATWTQVGQLYGFESANGMCVDADQNVYVTDYNKKEVFKYAHGAEGPEQALDDSTGFGIGCAVNPTNNDLAVTNQTLVSQDCGDVVIFAGGSGTPTAYTTANVCEDYNAAYDGKGDLFVAGTSTGGTYAMAELPSGETSFVNMTLDPAPTRPSGLQWDGRYLNAGSSAGILRFLVRGQTATAHHIVKLQGMNGMIGFFLPKFGPGIKDPLPRRVVTVGYGESSIPTVVGAYRFPAGGSARRTFTYQVFASAIVVSKSAK